MATREELEAFGILIAGGVAVAFIITVLGKRPLTTERQFTLNGGVCDPQGVLRWLDRLLQEGKITTDDVQRLLLTEITLIDWIGTVIQKRGFNASDLGELLEGICVFPPS